MTVIEIKKRGPLYEETLDLLTDNFDKKIGVETFLLIDSKEANQKELGILFK